MSTPAEGGTYELLRARLGDQARELAARARRLNDARHETFGSTDMALVGAARIRTRNNCVPRDAVTVGRLLLFGYNVFIGLRSETTVADVLSLHRLEATDGGAYELHDVEAGDPANFLADPAFVHDFGEVFRYYKDTRLVQLRRLEGRLLAVFQTGRAAADLKVFRWALERDGTVRYIDDRGEREHVFPPAHDFEWVETTRDDHVTGRYPHVSIGDELFVETLGGDLTIKVENNTETGEGIWSEPVDQSTQGLADADIHHCRLGPLILLRIRPYKEDTWRHLVFNTRTRQVERIDAIGAACQQLPEDHGLIFPGGYVLASGEHRTFEGDVDSMVFVEARRAPNGEDVLYAFHERTAGRTNLLPYNLIRKDVAQQVVCHGYGIFDDGTMVVLRAESEEPTRVHPLQIWRTPFATDDHAAAAPVGESFLEVVGNAELVRAVSDAVSIERLAANPDPSRARYEDLVARIGRMQDAHHWLGDPQVGDLATPLHELRSTAELVIDEFEKVEALRAQAGEAADQVDADLQTLLRELPAVELESVTQFVESLGRLRALRGRAVSLRDLRYVDLDSVAALEARATESFDAIAADMVGFVLADGAFAPYHERVAALDAEGRAADAAADAAEVASGLTAVADEMALVAEVIDGLEIDDARDRTRVLQSVSEVLAGVNRARSSAEGRRRDLARAEGAAEFGAQLALLAEAVGSGLGLAATPAACDDQLARLLAQVEGLEARFGDDDAHAEQLAGRRDDIYEAFTARKQAMLDERQRDADRLVANAERVLATVARRAAQLDSPDDVNAYFAADPMVERLRALSSRLRGLDDAVRADEIDGRLTAARQEAARTLRDRRDLFEDGAEVIRLGGHRFSVTTEPFELTVVPRDGHLELAVTGTDFRQPLDDPELAGTEAHWDQRLVSETAEVYRAEFLATALLADAEAREGDLSVERLLAAGAEGTLLDVVRRYAADRYDEGYERGVHDHDAALILHQLVLATETADRLRWPPLPRALACLFWAQQGGGARAVGWRHRAASLARLRASFGSGPAIPALQAEMAVGLRATLGADGAGLDVAPDDAAAAASYLFEELARPSLQFATSGPAVALRDALWAHLDKSGQRRAFDDDLAAVRGAADGPAGDLAARWQLVHAWLAGLLGATGDPDLAALATEVDEAAALVLTDAVAPTPPSTRRRPSTSSGANPAGGGTAAGGTGASIGVAAADPVAVSTAAPVPRATSSGLRTVHVTGLVGQHPRVVDGALALRLDEVLARTARFRRTTVPGFRRWTAAREQALARARHALRLDELRPKVMSTFVRNHLIDQAVLPLVGANLARQLGTVGEGRRTDQSGLLLLVSPPGYGKTTLMEYVASRLGLVFVKVNGPALGTGVTSLDPADAPDATARQEVDKINFALEMGNNVLLYLDDIQHTSPELLQKFISLCDAQRRMEGVWAGRTRTYDLRGKRFAVCMAGNPYTESGHRFRVPDMLANRADVHNLGDVLTGQDDLFALSYVENSLTANPVLAPLAGRDLADVALLVRMADGEEVPADRLSHPYSAVELAELVSVLRIVRRVQRVVMAVNQAYIASAGQDAAFRTEPPFLLQGSYRNMNKLVERIVPGMTDAEVESLLDDHYRSEAQTLTSGAEHNLLKLAELRGRTTPEQAARWAEVTSAFARMQALGDGSDPVARIAAQLGVIGERLGALRPGPAPAVAPTPTGLPPTAEAQTAVAPPAGTRMAPAEPPGASPAASGNGGSRDPDSLDPVPGDAHLDAADRG